MALATRYRVRTTYRSGTKTEWSKPLRARDALVSVRRRAKRLPHPYRLRWPWSNELGPMRSRPELISRLAVGFKNKDFDEDAVVTIICGEWSDEGMPKIEVRKIRIETGPLKREPNFAPGYDLSDVNPTLQNLIRIMAGIDYGVRCNGLAYTRKIAGSSLWSKHSRWRIFGCRGAAADLYFPLPPPTGTDMGRGDRMVGQAVALAKKGEMPGLKKLIWRNRYYDRDYGYAPRTYTGIYHYHIHMETDAYGDVCA